MKNILSIFALLIAFGFVGASSAHAETYLVNLDGSQGCGQYCDQLNAYLSTQNTNSSSSVSTASNGNTNSGQQAQGDSTSYPYQTYVNFASTDNYYKAGRNNAIATTSNGYNYVQYPYPMYNYFVNPNPYPSQNMSNGVYQSYPTPMYNYYGSKSSSSTIYTQPKTVVNPNTGFVLTAIR